MNKAKHLIITINDYRKDIFNLFGSMMPLQEECTKDLGMYGFDSPRNLLCHTLFKIRNDKPDVIVLNGDFIAHGVPLNNENATEEEKLAKWEEMKMVLSMVMREIRTKLPGVDILPSIGNNDVIVHY